MQSRLNHACSRLTLFTDKFQLQTALKAMPFTDATHNHALGIVRRLVALPVLILAGIAHPGETGVAGSA